MIAAISCNISIQSQTAWTNVDSLFSPLPKSMHLWFTNDSLEGKPNVAYYVKIALHDRCIIFGADTALNRGLTPSQYYARNADPLLVVNCSFFSKQRRNLNIVVDEGKMVSFNLPSVFSSSDSLYHYVTRSAIGIDRHRNADVAWIYTDTVRKKATAFSEEPVVSEGDNYYLKLKQLLADGNIPQKAACHTWKVETAVGGGPNLVSGGEINITNEEERMFTGKAINDRHPRTAMGYTSDGFLVIMVIEGRNPGRAEGATLMQEALMLKELGCVEALNLDGGGSSCMLINGKQTIIPCDKTGQRPVPAVFMIRSAKMRY